MNTQRYVEDVLREFQAQKQMVNDQLELMDPMAASLRQPAATRFLSAGLLILMEWCCYLLAIGCFALPFFMGKLYPFYLLPEMAAKQAVTDVMGIGNIQNLQWYMIGLVVLVGVLLFIIARNFNALRKKNSILNSAGRSIKTMASQLLKRKAAIEMIEQKHAFEAPIVTNKVLPGEPEAPPADPHHNPGYDGAQPLP